MTLTAAAAYQIFYEPVCCPERKFTHTHALIAWNVWIKRFIRNWRMRDRLNKTTIQCWCVFGARATGNGRIRMNCSRLGYKMISILCKFRFRIDAINHCDQNFMGGSRVEEVSEWVNRKKEKALFFFLHLSQLVRCLDSTARFLHIQIHFQLKSQPLNRQIIDCINVQLQSQFSNGIADGLAWAPFRHRHHKVHESTILFKTKMSRFIYWKLPIKNKGDDWDWRYHASTTVQL